MNIMDRFDRRILQFVLAWAPYVGPSDDDVFPEFGITADELRSRFLRIVASQAKCVRDLENADRVLLARASAYVRRISGAGRRPK
jgi:hypothetical protein